MFRAINIYGLLLTFIIALCPSVVFSASHHSSPAGLRWQIKDDTGWNAEYERLGIQGTIEDQTSITFIEFVDGEFLNDSLLEVLVTNEGRVRARRRKAEGNRNCLYTGQITDAPTILDQGFSLQNRASAVTGSYSCQFESKTGTWSGTILW